MNEDYKNDFELDERPRLATDSVPWIRSGYPTHRSEYNKWKSYVYNKGAPASRIYTDEQIIEYGSPGVGIERIWVMMWDYECNRSGNSLYEHLRSIPEVDELVHTDNEERLCQVAMLAAIQWLGTNCGYGFLHAVEQMTKYEIERLEELITPGSKKNKENMEKHYEEMRDKTQAEEIETKIKERYEQIIQTSVEEEVNKRLGPLIKLGIKKKLRKHRNKIKKNIQKGRAKLIQPRKLEI